MRRQRIIYTKNATDSDNVSADYLLVFHHNSSKRDLFKSEKDFLFANTENKYSIFGYIDDSFKFDQNNFEFLLEYPDDHTHGFWHQRVNPWEAPQDTDVGYIDKGKTFKGSVAFTGLTRFNKSYTYIEGCENGPEYWYYSIGSRTCWQDNCLIPGSYPGNSTNLKEVFLWIRIPSLSFLKTKSFGFITCTTKRSLLYSMLVYVLLICS